jgi:hypothetical protein
MVPVPVSPTHLFGLETSDLVCGGDGGNKISLRRRWSGLLRDQLGGQRSRLRGGRKRNRANS